MLMRLKANISILLVIAVVATTLFGCKDGSKGLVPDRDYYIFLTLIELAPKRDGKSWDLDRSAPDISYEIWWQDNRIFSSTTKRNTLIADWADDEFDIVGHFLGKGQQARIKYRPGEEIQVVVFDNDIPPKKDEAERRRIPFDSLREGENLLLGEGNLKRMVINVMDRSQLQERLKP
jgi:hypothetical protein